MQSTQSPGRGGPGRYEIRGDRLSELLADRHITQVAAATAMGIDRGHLNDILRGRKRRPGVKVMEALRRAFPDQYERLVVWTDDTAADVAVPAKVGEAQ